MIALEYIYEDNIEMDLKELGCESIKWSHLAMDREQWWALWTEFRKR
jgi:hypothetical protein